VLARPVSLDGDLHRLVGLRAGYRRGDVVGGRDRRAVEGGDHVTRLQSGPGGGAAFDDLGDLGATRRVLDPDAHVRVLHLAAGVQRLGDGVGDEDGDGDVDPGVVVRLALDLVVDADHRV